MEKKYNKKELAKDMKDFLEKQEIEVQRMLSKYPKGIAVSRDENGIFIHFIVADAQFVWE